MKDKSKVRKKVQKVHPIELRPAIDSFLPKGQFSYMLGDLQGRPIWDEPRRVDNTVVTAGRSWVLKHIVAAESTAVSSQIISALAIGTGTVAPTTSDTLLGSELVRVTVITETDNSTSSVPHCIWAASFNSTQGNATAANSGLDEFGLFNTSSANTSTMLARATTASFAKTTSNTLFAKWARSIERWMRKFLLIDSNPETETRANLCFTTLDAERLSEGTSRGDDATVRSHGNNNRERLAEMTSPCQLAA